MPLWWFTWKPHVRCINPVHPLTPWRAGAALCGGHGPAARDVPHVCAGLAGAAGAALALAGAGPARRGAHHRRAGAHVPRQSPALLLQMFPPLLAWYWCITHSCRWAPCAHCDDINVMSCHEPGSASIVSVCMLSAANRKRLLDMSSTATMLLCQCSLPFLSSPSIPHFQNLLPAGRQAGINVPAYWMAGDCGAELPGEPGDPDGARLDARAGGHAGRAFRAARAHGAADHLPGGRPRQVWRVLLLILLPASLTTACAYAPSVRWRQL